MKMEEITKNKIMKSIIVIMLIFIVGVSIQNHRVCRANAELRYELLVMQCEDAETEDAAKNLIFRLEKVEIDPYLGYKERSMFRNEIDRLHRQIAERCERGDFREVPEPSVICERFKSIIKDAFKCTDDEARNVEMA